MNTNFKVIGLTRLVIKPESTARVGNIDKKSINGCSLFFCNRVQKFSTFFSLSIEAFPYFFAW